MKKVCSICKCAIDTNLDNYSQVKSYAGKNELSKRYYHTLCFMERIAVKAKGNVLLNQAAKMLQRANTKMKGVGI